MKEGVKNRKFPRQRHIAMNILLVVNEKVMIPRSISAIRRLVQVIFHSEFGREVPKENPLKSKKKWEFNITWKMDVTVPSIVL